jgi:hypothetical protein
VAVRAVLRRMTPLDRGIVLVLLLLTGFLFFFAGSAPPGQRVVVERDGRVIFTAPLSVDRTVALKGPLGETVLAIRHGRARITSSPCPRKICMGMGAIARSGEILACVPNHLLVRIAGEKGKKRKDYDLLSR